MLLGLALAAAAGPALARPGLTVEQERRLDAGGVILLDVLPPGGDVRGSHGGTAVAVVRAAGEAVWRVLIDYAGHSGMYPRVIDARILHDDVGHSLVRYVVGIGPLSFAFHVNNYPDERRHRLSWRLARDRRNGLFTDSWGYWQIDPDEHGVLLTYAMAARTVLPSFMTRGAERDGLVETVHAVRRRVETEQ
jgi:hypothetical protein